MKTFENWFPQGAATNARVKPCVSGADAVEKELTALSVEVAHMTRNFSIAEAEAMKSGKPRDGAGVLEKAIRAKYRRINELSKAHKVTN